MPFKAEFIFDTLPELQDFIADIEGKKTPQAEASKDEVSHGENPPKSKGGRPPKSVALPTGQKVPTFIGKKNVEVETAPVAQEEVEAEPALTYNYVAKATTDAVAALGTSQPIRALLAEFGVDHGSKLDKEDWAEYIRRCGDLIKGTVTSDAHLA